MGPDDGKKDCPFCDEYGIPKTACVKTDGSCVDRATLLELLYSPPHYNELGAEDNYHHVKYRLKKILFEDSVSQEPGILEIAQMFERAHAAFKKLLASGGVVPRKPTSELRGTSRARP